MDLLDFSIKFIDFNVLMIEGLCMNAFSSKKEAEDFAENFKKLCNYANFPLKDYNFDFTVVKQDDYFVFTGYANED